MTADRRALETTAYSPPNENGSCTHIARTRLSITLPDDVWIEEVSTAHPGADFDVLAAMPGDGEDAGFGVVRIDAPDVDPRGRRPRVAVGPPARRRTGDRPVRDDRAPDPALGAGVTNPDRAPGRDPGHGVATVDVTGSREHLSELGDRLRRFGRRFEVEYVHERVDTEELLSERQREVLLAAAEGGYYDTPRGCSLTELAEELGVAKSTCSETLHHVEEVIVKRFVRELPEREGAAPPAPTDRS